MCHPAVVLVDEHTHTNIEGCKHGKRYSDVLELNLALDSSH